MKKAILYIRVSTDEQAERGHSLAYQEDKLLKLLERHNDTGDSHGSSVTTEEELLDYFRENPATLRDMDKHTYFATESDYSSNSDS